MIINLEHCFIFYHIPKCAGTTTRDRLMKYDSFNRYFYGYQYNSVLEREVDKSHITHEELRTYSTYISDMEHYYKFCFIRNPYTRVYSSWIQYKKHFLNGLTDNERKVVENFDEFILKSLTKDKIEVDHHYTHFKPVYSYIYDKNGNNIMDFIGKVENYEIDFENVAQTLNLIGIRKLTTNVI